MSNFKIGDRVAERQKYLYGNKYEIGSIFNINENTGQALVRWDNNNYNIQHLSYLIKVDDKPSKKESFLINKNKLMFI